MEARSQPAAMAAAARVDGAGERLHGQIVGDQNPLESDEAADDLGDDAGRYGGRALGVYGGDQQMAGHAQRHVGQGPKRTEVAGLQLRQRRLDHREAEMAVDLAAAMSGQMLDHRRDPGRKETLTGRPAQGGHDLGIGGEGAVADDLMGAGKPEIQGGAPTVSMPAATSSPAMSRALSRTASAARAGSLRRARRSGPAPGPPATAGASGAGPARPPDPPAPAHPHGRRIGAARPRGREAVPGIPHCGRRG
jgi:hypothetical protein